MTSVSCGCFKYFLMMKTNGNISVKTFFFPHIEEFLERQIIRNNEFLVWSHLRSDRWKYRTFNQHNRFIRRQNSIFIRMARNSRKFSRQRTRSIGRIFWSTLLFCRWKTFGILLSSSLLRRFLSDHWKSSIVMSIESYRRISRRFSTTFDWFNEEIWWIRSFLSKKCWRMSSLQTFN